MTDFAFAQARAQARHGERLALADWQLLESGRSLAQYLHSARCTSLAPLVQHITPASSPHAIERSLRVDWRGIVENTARWVPAAWRAAIRCTAWLADLPALAYLQTDAAVLPWMTADPQLSAFTDPQLEARRSAMHDAGLALLQANASPESPLEAWIGHWQTTWPVAPAARPGLLQLVSMLRQYRQAVAQDTSKPVTADELRRQLHTRVARMMRLRQQQPVAVFCHLVLAALEMQRLRSGLIRRALFNDLVPDSAS